MNRPKSCEAIAGSLREQWLNPALLHQRRAPLLRSRAAGRLAYARLPAHIAPTFRELFRLHAPGANTSGAAPRTKLLKPGDATPTTVKGWLFTRMVSFTTRGSEPNRLCQYP